MLILKNATIITGDGSTVVPLGTVVVDSGRIVEVRERAVTGGPRDQVYDLTGCLVVPGAINVHAHGCVLCPLFASGAPPLSRDQVLANLDKHLLGGTTTVLSCDGFNTPEEVASIAGEHPVNIRFATIHFEPMFEVARRADGSGLTATHEGLTVEEMLNRGAVAIGEVGAGHTLAGGGTDYMYIPMAIERETGVRLEPRQARLLKFAVLGRRVQPEAYDRERVAEVLAEVGLAGRLTPERARDIVHQIVLPAFELALEGIREGARLAVRYGVPTLVHKSAPSEKAVYEAAELAGALLVAGHTNHNTFTVEESVACARTLRAKGAFIEVSTLDAFGARRLVPAPDHLYALLQNDLVDIVATDYAGGYWDNIYTGLARAIDEGIVTLPRAVALATKNVTKAFPKLAPDRGEIAPGKVADLVVCRGCLDQVDKVFIEGRLVCDDGKVLRDDGQRPQ
jgi:imidazolonepropionase-like amidohydrolase